MMLENMAGIGEDAGSFFEIGCCRRIRCLFEPCDRAGVATSQGSSHG